ncbi:probable xyloglucan galactosyltransferase GT17 [Lingula anatina]|uniref:Probable xyloglucan galactosyltransferase GT17 n=1 Tax=Lingula anatina TaxID=7574 RepID=A0A1S3K6M4_LINAN|nr:probable xyloglucan galactosyltransferase GT17 [Lingula anatina]XP_013417906.1 probable xyloglucan galactosyltransferase GT17 [Lingula anatina]|eukprot:XP_013417905.1 probable xyloglucan galactosyltransferase GT17 [Lingula anatina]
MISVVSLVILVTIATGQHICDNQDTQRANPPVTSIPDYRVYVYDLPPRFTSDLLNCANLRNYCFDLRHQGMGEQLYQDGPLSIRDTHQFSLEVLMHHKLMHSTRRTNNPSEADLFYIPFYSALTCFCRQGDYDQLEQLYAYLRGEWGAHFPSKPHFGILSKIEREQYSVNCPTLRHPDSRLVTWVGIEQEVVENNRKYYNVTGELVVAPYPSYGHFIQGENITAPALHSWLYNHTRTVRVFMAAGERRSNPFRNLILDQFPPATDVSYTEHMAARGRGEETEMVWLKTPECQGRHRNTTMLWMKHAVFCVQPSGDSPTRKSFYDAILSGCIPVIFEFKNKVKYPFSASIDYSKFTVSIPEENIKAGVSILHVLNRVTSDQIKDMQRHLVAVAPLLQYSYPPLTRGHHDAVDMILHEIAKNVFYKDNSTANTAEGNEGNTNQTIQSKNLDPTSNTQPLASNSRDSHDEL